MSNNYFTATTFPLSTTSSQWATPPPRSLIGRLFTSSVITGWNFLVTTGHWWCAIALFLSFRAIKKKRFAQLEGRQTPSSISPESAEEDHHGEGKKGMKKSQSADERLRQNSSHQYQNETPPTELIPQDNNSSTNRGGIISFCTSIIQSSSSFISSIRSKFPFIIERSFYPFFSFFSIFLLIPALLPTSCTNNPPYLISPLQRLFLSPFFSFLMFISRMKKIKVLWDTDDGRPFPFQSPDHSFPNSRPYLMVSAPHGRFGVGYTYIFSHPLFYKAKLTVLGASAAIHAPFIGLLCRLYGVQSVSKSNVERLLSEKRNICLVPGGIAEMLLCRPFSHYIHLFRHQGFLKLAMKYRVQLVPTFYFGAADEYDSMVPGLERFFYQLIRLPIPPLYGTTPDAPDIVHQQKSFFERLLTNIFSPFPLPLPNNVPYLIAIGKPIDCSQYSSVDELEIVYMNAVNQLFNKFKSKCSPFESIWKEREIRWWNKQEFVNAFQKGQIMDNNSNSNVLTTTSTSNTTTNNNNSISKAPPVPATLPLSKL